MTEQKPDFFFYRNLQSESGNEFWQDELSLAENFMTLWKEVVALPDPNILLPIITSYCLLPSAMATIVPVLFIQGNKGSGKSTALQLIAAVHDQVLLSAASTAVAVRNHINTSRWDDPTTLTGERNTLFLFDNVTQDTLKNEFLYLLFLNGYNRQTDLMMISGGQGINLSFRIFGLKVISTIHDILGKPEYSELARRCLVVRFKQWEKFTEEEKAGLEDFNPLTMTQIENLNLSILKEKYDAFWREENLLRYSTTKKSLNRRRKSLKLPDSFNSARWTISTDLLVTGVVLDLWDIDSGLATLGQYWEWFDVKGKPGLSPLQQVLQAFIEQEESQLNHIAQITGSYVERSINPKRIKEIVKLASESGELDEYPTPQAIAKAMQSLGYEIKKRPNGRMISWVPMD